MITLYTKNNCQQCRATSRHLEGAGLDFQSVNLDTNPKAVDLVKAMGYSQAPVVVTDTDHWSGFRPDKLAALKVQDSQARESSAEQSSVRRLMAQNRTADFQSQTNRSVSRSATQQDADPVHSTSARGRHSGREERT